MEIKTKINKWDLIKLKKLLHSKGNYKQGEKAILRTGENNNKWNKWQRINFQNIQAAHTTQYQNNKQLNQKVGKGSEQAILQRRHTDEKRCSTSLIIREMQIKTTMRYHFTPVRMAIIKKSANYKCWRGCGEKGTLLHCWWECKLIQPLWKIWFLKKLGVELT